ncbi:MAG: type II toxin-antitoxin system VapC family toxin [Deltaproteobacteria bacterium]|nr:type II toxin-antitoxin system VapC family toxin [Deltaproteobacteria bacterium]
MAKKTKEAPSRLFWDASYLIAYFAPQDRDHKRALKIREYLVHNKIKFCTSWPNISEAATLLLYHYGYSGTSALFHALKTFEIILPLEEEYDRATILFSELNKDQKLSFNDVLTYLLIRERLKNMPLLTFDRDFSKVGLTVFVP